MFLTPFVTWSPLISIIIFSAIITLISTWLYKKLMNYNKYKDINERQKALRKEMKETKDSKRLMEIQNAMMSLSMDSFRLTLKPMLITFLPFLAVFALLRQAYTSAAIGDIIKWGTKLPVIGTGGGWFFCYVIFSLVFSLIFRKIFKM
jgi:uncharacterized membrane protein (DUF106 family)